MMDRGRFLLNMSTIRSRTLIIDLKGIDIITDFLHKRILEFFSNVVQVVPVFRANHTLVITCHGDDEKEAYHPSYAQRPL